jgi:hypothetical protein
MFSTFSKSAIHLKDELNKIMPNEPFDEEEVREMLFDAVFTQIDDDTLDLVFDGNNQQLLEQGKLSEADILLLLEQKIPTFHTIMEHLVGEIIKEYKSP